jgi:hypothetical protein
LGFSNLKEVLSGDLLLLPSLHCQAVRLSASDRVAADKHYYMSAHPISGAV